MVTLGLMGGVITIIIIIISILPPSHLLAIMMLMMMMTMSMWFSPAQLDQRDSQIGSTHVQSEKKPGFQPRGKRVREGWQHAVYVSRKILLELLL